MCELTSGHAKQGCPSIGGIKSVVALNIENIDTYTASAGVLSAITMKSSKTGFRIKPDMASIDFTETANRSRENNTLYYGVSGSITLKDDTTETRALTDLMSKGFLVVIIEKESGQNLVFGLSNGLTTETAEITTGKNFEDLNGSVINMVGKEPAIAPSITDALISGII